jgi:hypothetical protein
MKNVMLRKEETISTIWTLPSIVDDGNEPKLSLQQLIAMALVASPTRSLSMEEICTWINDGFQYYKDPKFQPAASNWRVELNDILHGYDFPTEPRENFCSTFLVVKNGTSCPSLTGQKKNPSLFSTCHSTSVL